MIRLAFVLVGVLCASPATAQLCERFNATQAARAARVALYERMYAGAVASLEQVPPDMAAYIDAEAQAAIDGNNSARFQIVFKNPFYHPRQVFKNYDVIRDNLEAAKSAPTVSGQVVYLSVVLARHSDLAGALSDYLEFDAGRAERVVSRESAQQIWERMTFAKGQVLETLQCGVRQMREP